MKKILSLFFVISVIFSSSLTSFASYDFDKILNDTAMYVYNTVKEPQVGSVGGEWAVLGLARSDINIPDEYFTNYCKTVENYVKEKQGILHTKKYTEYSRVIVALTSIGKNPENVSGYNLLIPLGDFEKTIWQGINGAIWALIALDSGNYEIPYNKDANIQATREMYINHILEKQTSDGGWALSGDKADPDITGMALQALSGYQDKENVKSATQRALICLSDMQDEKGGFSSYGAKNSESCVQVIVALCDLDISINDSRFVKNGHTLLDSLMTFYNNDGFKHILSADKSNLMATEQALYCMVSVKRKEIGKSGLYKMKDQRILSETKETLIGLKNKHPDIKKMSIINPGKTFFDISTSPYKQSIEALCERGIINGKTDSSFEPDSTMTRAEFATIITRGLGLPINSKATFNDVTKNDWFYDYVNTAYSYGIIKGISDKEFNPYGTITREESAVMIVRAASLCGMETEMDSQSTRDVLAQFFDYVKASSWSQSSLAFCYQEKILDDSVMDIMPKEAVTRGEIASMLYNMLNLSKLI